MRTTIHAALAAGVVAAALWPGAGMAYFGPGAGVTMLGAVWGVILAIVFALFALLAWPIRALLRRRRKAAQVEGSPASIAKPDIGA